MHSVLLNNIGFGIRYVIDHNVFRKTTPLICGINVTNRCNLKCRHCRVQSRGTMDTTYKEIIGVVDSFYKEGGRLLYFEGGEPFLWHEGKRTLDDIIIYARKKGFFSTVIYTNGTFSLKTLANTVFISLDGLKETHDFIRGLSFERIMDNIYQAEHPSLYINYTINNYNKDEIGKFCKFISGIPNIRGTFFYFHTPYYGYDNLYIEPNERVKIMRKLLEYRKEYKILNSRAGLISAIENNWKRPLSICRVYEKGTIYNCCRYPGDPELCRNCGYLSYAEIHQTFSLKPSAIINALKYF